MRDRLKALRQRLGGATQEEFAIIVGVNVSSVRAWEQQKRQPSKLALKQIEHLELDEEIRALAQKDLAAVNQAIDQNFYGPAEEGEG